MFVNLATKYFRWLIWFLNIMF